MFDRYKELLADLDNVTRNERTDAINSVLEVCLYVLLMLLMLTLLVCWYWWRCCNTLPMCLPPHTSPSHGHTWTRLSPALINTVLERLVEGRRYLHHY